jgi:signal transduction histidine kinase
MSDHPKTRIKALDLRLLANFIHQLINPLNGVIGTLDNIIEGSVPPQRREQRLRAVRAQLEHAVLLVRNLAYFSETSADKIAGEYAPKICIVPQLIIEAILFFQEEGLSRGVKIHLTDRETQYAVTGIPELFRQVMMNLFDNCVKYAEEGSMVSVQARIQKKTGDVIIEVESRGATIGKDELTKVFDLGYRGVGAKKKLASGTGLGLYICKRIVEDVHRGTIEVESTEKTGVTMFRIRLPEGRIHGAAR